MHTVTVTMMLIATLKAAPSTVNASKDSEEMDDIALTLTSVLKVGIIVRRQTSDASTMMADFDAVVILVMA